MSETSRGAVPRVTRLALLALAPTACVAGGCAATRSDANGRRESGAEPEI